MLRQQSSLLCFLAVTGSAAGFVPLQSSFGFKPTNAIRGAKPQGECKGQPHEEEEILQRNHNLQESLSNLRQIEATSTSSIKPLDPKEKVDMDRAAFRLDGLEVYAVVSALTLATSIQFFDLLSHDWKGGMAFAVGIPRWEATLGLTGDLICLGASALGMITGLHATLVFALMTVYGRTAVGMGWDTSFYDFFRQTNAVRYRGFQSFRISLYTFLVQILFIIVSRLPPVKWIRWTGCAVLSVAMWRVYGDTQFIIDKAESLLFTRPKESKTVTKKKKNAPASLPTVGPSDDDGGHYFI